MDTIASLLAGATRLAVHLVSYTHQLAATHTAGQPTGAGSATLVVVILVVAIVMAVKSAVHGLSELLRALTAMMSSLFILAAAIGLVVILLLHHLARPSCRAGCSRRRKAAPSRSADQLGGHSAA